jgi:hypothetical protein
MPSGRSGNEFHETDLAQVGFQQLSAVKTPELFDLLVRAAVIDLHVKGVYGIKGDDVVVFPAFAKQDPLLADDLCLNRKWKQFEIGKTHAEGIGE